MKIVAFTDFENHILESCHRTTGNETPCRMASNTFHIYIKNKV